MERTDWIIAAACAVIGACVWLYVDTVMHAYPAMSPVTPATAPDSEPMRFLP